uniref:Uncharacterized protein n=1 Tax=Kwoniella bestiolae CBS 10118 TaxID=1296100 RepID=A0A1B9FTC9_9TREE|nr:hypothetical protein I302_08803 [Kwoniella bestiolae CBS 10118]OCF22022.1 hypothetical protein I302_08803 [Kwoniella bestiolae CBS 10118]
MRNGRGPLCGECRDKRLINGNMPEELLHELMAAGVLPPARNPAQDVQQRQLIVKIPFFTWTVTY